MDLACEETHRLKHDHLGTEHLLLGMTREGTGIGAGVLQELGIDTDALRAEIERRSHGPNTANPPQKPRQTQRLLRVFEYAGEEADAMHHDHIGTEHLLLGILREPDGTAARALINLNVQAETIRDAIRGKVERDPVAVNRLCEQAASDLKSQGVSVADEALHGVINALVNAGWRPRP
jgi:ATP-dependent Clp protease ATP-binding subunit ClpC